MYEPYWPTGDTKELEFDDVKVKLLREKKFIGITIRKFSITKGTEVNLLVKFINIRMTCSWLIHVHPLN